LYFWFPAGGGLQMDEFFELLGEGAGWIIGLGITLGAASAFSNGAKPVAKKAIKGYLTASDRARIWAAEMGEHIEDIYAEARMEYDASRQSTNNGVATARIVVPGQETR